MNNMIGLKTIVPPISIAVAIALMAAFLRLVSLLVATFFAALLRMTLVVFVFLVMAVFSMVSLVVIVIVAFLMVTFFAC